jgi:hypothetical protein
MISKKDIPDLVFSNISEKISYLFYTGPVNRDPDLDQPSNVPVGAVGFMWYDIDFLDPCYLFIVIGQDRENLHIIQPRIKVVDNKLVLGTDKFKDKYELELFPCESFCGFSGCHCYEDERREAMDKYISSFVEVDEHYEYEVRQVRFDNEMRMNSYHISNPSLSTRENLYLFEKLAYPSFLEGTTGGMIKSATKI